MKCKEFFQTTATVLILALLFMCGNIGAVYGTDEGGINENLIVVDVTDYGAKSFTEAVECELEANSATIIATNGVGNLNVGDTIKIVNGVETGSPGKDLTAEITAINGNSITLDKACGNTITTKVYIDSTQAFKNAFNYANNNNYDVIIPEGNYYIDGIIYIQTNVTCLGKLYTSNKDKDIAHLFSIIRKETAVEISGNDIETELSAGITNIPELEGYADYDVIFYSTESDEKAEINRITDNNGTLMVGLSQSYNDKSKLLLTLCKAEAPITLEGLDISCIDSIVNLYKTIVTVKRSDVTFNGFIMDKDNQDNLIDTYTGIGMETAVNVEINDSKISGGIGFPIMAYCTLYLTLNDTEISQSRCAIVGETADNYTIINGGSYKERYGGYGSAIYSNWGHNITVKDADITGFIIYAGENFTIDNCNMITGYHTLINKSTNFPSIKGNVKIKNSTVTYKDTDNFSFYEAELTDIEPNVEIYNPNLVLENVELVLENDINVVDIYTINHDLNKQYIVQKLPENIQINNLYITGENDSKLKNTRFRMVTATNKYYTGNPEVYLENIRINRDTESQNSLNYDGEIAYSFHPDHTEAEVPDTHYKMTVKDCGTLSVNIVPTILGDMVIENCNIIDYIYAGDIENDWPNNTVWWYKGTGKTVFKDVQFDRTGLPASSISIMNDAEFERCEFTNYGTIDYMNFGGELPTVQILRVQDCIFNEGGITGGTLSESLISSNSISININDYGAKDFIEPVVCTLNKTKTIVAVNGTGNLSVGDTVRIINGTEIGSPGIDLTAKITAIAGNTITLNKKCGSKTTTKVYIDSTQAFKDAFNYANSNNYDIIIPEGNYFVDSDIDIQTNVTCSGKLYTSNKGNTSLFYVMRKEGPITISGDSIAGSLEEGTNNIPELVDYMDYDVIFNSQERIMWRNNSPGEYYTKNEANRIDSDGFLMVGLVESYHDKSLLSLRLYKKERPITLEGLNILCIDDNVTGDGKSIIMVRRSDVTFENLVLDNENLSRDVGQDTGVAIIDAVNVTINNSKIRGLMYWGSGYGVKAFNTLNVTLNNTDISKTRHAVTGRHDNFTIINGGSYESYFTTLDSHWGYNYKVNNVTIYGDIAFSYDGVNLAISNCTITTYDRLLIYRREDCPSIKGNVEVKDTTITYTGSSDFMFYLSKLTDYEHDAEIYNPNLIIENVELILENDINVVDICTINHDLNKQYIMQKLPENIQVNNLYITGENDSKLKNTRFRMVTATNKYYTGNPEVYLENIRINRDTESQNSLNYDGEIAYSFHPDHTEAEVPDTHYKMTVKDCGTLSVNIVPTILGDMVIENCNIIDYIYAGDIENDWPNNTVWWYKGTGKTVFKDVQFDRTGLPASSISIMNDAEFERCEFTNYGTIDYMNFGDELPTVQILRVEDCIINEGGITGGSLSEFMTPGTGEDEPEDTLFTVGDINFTDLGGVKITKLIGGTDIKATVAISSNTENVVPGAIILALYDENDRIANFSMTSQDISEETEVTLATGFRLPLNIDGYKVKAFIWDSWETMKPLSNRVIFP